MQLQLTGQRSSPITVHKSLVLCSVFFETLNNVSLRSVLQTQILSIFSLQILSVNDLPTLFRSHG